MLSGVGLQSTHGANGTTSNVIARTNSGQTGALNAQIRRDQVQLNDWLTCVSASTPKGRSEIQSLSARISAAKQHIARLNAEKGATGPPAIEHSSGQANAMASGTSDAAKSTNAVVSTQATSRRGGLVDTWA